MLCYQVDIDAGSHKHYVYRSRTSSHLCLDNSVFLDYSVLHLMMHYRSATYDFLFIGCLL